jgi:Predicted dehydrogenases and related proteins
MVKIGVLGAGHLGKIHSKLLREIRGFTLVGIYDIELKQSQTLAQEIGVTAFATAQELMEAVDAVDIVTPTTTHFQYAQMAIRQGRHVFVEKPLAQTLEEAAQLVQLVGEAKVKAMVGHVERFNPALLAARPFIRKPMFIESHRLAQFNPRGTDVPVVLDLMIHDLDVIRHLVAEPVRRISASGVAVVSASPDIAQCPPGNSPTVV